jgi:hypothetical protein
MQLEEKPIAFTVKVVPDLACFDPLARAPRCSTDTHVNSLHRKSDNKNNQVPKQRKFVKYTPNGSITLRILE